MRSRTYAMVAIVMLTLIAALGLRAYCIPENKGGTVAHVASGPGPITICYPFKWREQSLSQTYNYWKYKLTTNEPTKTILREYQIYFDQ